MIKYHTKVNQSKKEGVQVNNINPKILEALEKNNNVITTSKIESLGFSKQLLSKYVKSGLLLRMNQGVYTLPNVVQDDMYSLMLRSSYIVFSHESSLFLNQLSNRTPFIHSITLPSDKSISRSIKSDCICFYVKPELYQIGITMKKNTFGNTIRCYDSERTICDLLRTRKRCDEEVVVYALKNYACSEQKDLNKLASYAKLFKVDTDIKRYMEVLL